MRSISKNNSTRKTSGKTGTVALVTLALLVLVTLGVIYFAINLSPVGWRRDTTEDLPLKAETLATYLEDPASCAPDLDKIYDKVSLISKNGPVYDIKLANQEGKGLSLHDIDLRVFIPSVPAIARGDKLLTHITLLQRELNRIDTIFDNTGYDAYRINISNNCLRCGLWEAYVTRRQGEDRGKIFHGWFEFPIPLYKKLFKEVNGFDLSAYEAALEHYQRLDGKKIPLDYLRYIQETQTLSSADLELHPEESITHFAEQRAKAKLIATSGLHLYKDIYDRKKQPVKLMQFDEPGIYKKKKLMKFDYSFFSTPDQIELRKVDNKRLGKSFNELEIRLPYGKRNAPIKNWPFVVSRNGLRIILGGWTLDDIPLATEQPIPASEFARFTFGIGTPEIYSSYESRLADLKKEKTAYLLLVDENDRYVDNHTLGLDQIYLSRLEDGTFVMYLVSYERIMLLAHWNFKLPQHMLVSENALEPSLHPDIGSGPNEKHDHGNDDGNTAGH